MFDVKGKRILITGSTGYFGKHICKGFLEAGATVILIARSSDKMEKQLEELKEYSCFGVIVDFYDIKNAESILNNISDSYHIDVLINNAYDLSEKTGFNTPNGKLENSTYYEWYNAFISGIYSTVLTSKAIGRQFIKRKKGNIINISSMYGIVSPNPKLYKDTEFFNPATYNVVKAGIIGLTKNTASFWGEHGVRCNAIAPGPFPKNVDNEEFINRLKDRTLLNDVGVPEDLMGGLIYLASDSSRYVTGQVLQIDGGWTVT